MANKCPKVQQQGPHNRTKLWADHREQEESIRSIEKQVNTKRKLSTYIGACSSHTCCTYIRILLSQVMTRTGRHYVGVEARKSPEPAVITNTSPQNLRRWKLIRPMSKSTLQRKTSKEPFHEHILCESEDVEELLSPPEPYNRTFFEERFLIASKGPPNFVPKPSVPIFSPPICPLLSCTRSNKIN